MATRATYSFEQEFSKEGLTIYVHWDNYPEGAAIYFWNMYKHLYVKGELAEAFVKGNPMSTEFTKSHDWHGDTDYRYYLDRQGFLQAQKMDPITGAYVKTFFSGHYAEFINKYDEYLVEEDIGFERLHVLSDSVRTISSHTCLTLTEVKAKLIDLYTSVINGNGSHYKEWLLIWEAEYQRLKSLSK